MKIPIPPTPHSPTYNRVQNWSRKAGINVQSTVKGEIVIFKIRERPRAQLHCPLNKDSEKPPKERSRRRVLTGPKAKPGIKVSVRSEPGFDSPEHALAEVSQIRL